MSTIDPPISFMQFASDPYATLKILRDHHPVYQFPETGDWILSRYEDVAAAFKDAEAFSSAAQANVSMLCGGRTIIEMDGEEHRLKRNIVAPVFAGKAFAALLPVVQRNLVSLVERYTEKHARRLANSAVKVGEIDIVDDFATRLPLNVIVDLLDLPRESHEEFHEWYPLIIAAMTHPAYLQAGLAANAKFHALIDPLIDERAKTPGDDLISRLVTAEVDGQRMSKAELKAFCSILFVGGAETTDKAIGNIWYWMIAHPDQFAKIQEDPGLLEAAFDEMMRIHPPALGMHRTTTRDVELHGKVIPPGARVMLCIYGANRDERVFDDPDTFNIFRQSKAGHLGFGLGVHFCIGRQLARLETVTASRELMKLIKNPRFKPGTNPGPIAMRAEPWQLMLEFDAA